MRKKYADFKKGSPCADKIAKRATSYDISRDIFPIKSQSVGKNMSFDYFNDEIEVDEDIDPLDRFQFMENGFEVLHSNERCQM